MSKKNQRRIESQAVTSVAAEHSKQLPQEYLLFYVFFNRLENVRLKC